MLHIIKYRMKCKLRNRILLFWNLLFPLILTTLFGLVLVNTFNPPAFDTIAIGIVDNTAYRQDTMLQQVLKQAKNGNHALFHVQIVDEQKANSLLQSNAITAYLIDGETIRVNVHDTGLNQTITKMFFDDYTQQRSMIASMMKDGKSMVEIQKIFTETNSYVKEQTVNNSDAASVYFFSILAMNALIGGHWAISSMRDLQANQSSKGQRMAVSPTHKAVNMLVDLMLNIVIQMAYLMIIFLYMIGVFHISFGNHFPYIVILLIVGSFAGNGLGSIIGNLGSKLTMDARSGILTAISLFASVLAGMMVMDIRYWIEVYVPILGYINPVNMITDGLYALYYYGVGDRYYFDLVLLVVFTILCYLISFFSIRKKAYDSLEVE